MRSATRLSAKLLSTAARIEMKRNDRLITAEQLRSVLDYDPTTGVFRWSLKRRWRTDLSGQVAGHFNKKYITIFIFGRQMQAHRLAWLYHYGQHASSDVDHFDRNPHNNAISNLRLADRSQNCCNVGLRRSSRSGLKGVSWKADAGKWVAQIQFRKQAIHLGYFDSKSAAAAAYNLAAKDIHGTFAVINGSSP